MKRIHKCKACDTYTMAETCPKCSGNAISVRPPKFSPEDKYAKYRREALLEKRQKEDLI